MIRGVVIAVALAAFAALVVLGVYGDRHGAMVTAAILLPLGVAIAVGAYEIVSRPASLRRQLLALGALAGAGLAAAVVLFVASMFISHHDALLTGLLVAYMAVVVGWAARLLGHRVLDDVGRIRATLAAVADGRRDVRTGASPAGEIGALAGDVDMMIARLAGEERARRTLLAGLSHDLRTPLTALRLLAEAIDDEVVDARTAREYAGRIGTHVRALDALIGNLFEVSRLERGEVSWKLERIDDLNVLVEEAVEAMRPSAAAAEVDVRTELAASMPVRVDPEALMRVVFNLLANAIRHTPAGGSVRVRATDAAGGVEIEVVDTGTGIAPADRPHVFEPFFRGGEAAARSESGSGLGLAVSRAIVEAHGGRIWLRDCAHGTTIALSLPG